LRKKEKALKGKNLTRLKKKGGRKSLKVSKKLVPKSWFLKSFSRKKKNWDSFQK
jgi:hypothetical protein